MIIWLLSHLKQSPGNDLFLRAALARGHDAVLMHPSNVDFAFPIKPDVVFPRMGASASEDLLRVLERLEQIGISTVNSVSALRSSRDKAKTYELLGKQSIPTPKTRIILSRDNLSQVASQLGGFPLVVKLPVSTKGIGVFLVHSEEELLETGARYEGALIVQQCIREAHGVDTRVMVIAGSAVAAVRRVNTTGDFRSNMHQGAKAEPAQLSEELATIAEASAAALGLDVAGVDVLQGPAGPLVIEVNGSPGMQSHVACGQAVPEKIVQYLEALVPTADS